MVSRNWEMGIQSRGEPPPADRETERLREYTKNYTRTRHAVYAVYAAVYTQYIQHCMYGCTRYRYSLVVCCTLRGTRGENEYSVAIANVASWRPARVRLNERAATATATATTTRSYFACRMSQLAARNRPSALRARQFRASRHLARSPGAYRRRMAPRSAARCSIFVASLRRYPRGTSRHVAPQSRTRTRPTCSLYHQPATARPPRKLVAIASCGTRVRCSALRGKYAATTLATRVRFASWRDARRPSGRLYRAPQVRISTLRRYHYLPSTIYSIPATC